MIVALNLTDSMHDRCDIVSKPDLREAGAVVDTRQLG